MGASSSFGNMFSVLGASVFVPYLPMTPIQILTNNLLYDVSQTAIPTDAVDPEQIARPRPWDIGSITRFIVFIGPCSSIFDYTTFLIMLYVFNAWAVEKAALFQTGWFVESLLTQTLIVHVIRTRKIPFLQSRASAPLIAMTVVIMSIAVEAIRTGLNIGRVTCQKRCRTLAPSIFAASQSSSGIDCRAPRIMTR